MPNRKLIGAFVVIGAVGAAAGLVRLVPSAGLIASVHADQGPSDAVVIELFKDYVRTIYQRTKAVRSLEGPGLFGPCGRATLGNNASDAVIQNCQADETRKEDAEFEANLAQFIVTITSKTNLEGNYLVLINARKRGTDDTDNYKLLLHQENGEWATVKAERVQ